MNEFKTSLLREKFTIIDPESHALSAQSSLTAQSNRLPLSLINGLGDVAEHFVIRAHNMHSCVRMAARILLSYEERGPILNRPIPYDWEAVWNSLANDYEKKYHPENWVTVYNKGTVIFKAGTPHPFLDVIEKCDATQDGDYDMSVPLAEKAFKEIGKTVKIDHDENVALAIHFEKRNARCGIIFRGPERTTTFTFTATPRDPAQKFPHSQSLAASAAFLEGIQMCFLVGMTNEKLRRKMIEPNSDEDKQKYEAKARIRRAAAEIANFETALEVRYRPERPEFDGIIKDTQEIASQVFDAQDIV